MENNTDNWFNQIRKILKYRYGHIDTPGHNPNIKPPDHPNCRCKVIVFMPDITKKLVQEYIIECKKSLIWIN